MKKKTNKKNFRRTASKVNSKNIPKRVMRGGIRL